MIGALEIIGIVLGLIVLFHIVVGRVKLEESRSGQLVQRWSLGERVLHWYTAILFIILAITGLSMLFGKAVLIPLLGPVGFSAWAAWHRRSLALTMVVVMWAAMWLPWARIDRATFQYHVYASLPFMVVALAYFLGELWHGAGWTYLLWGAIHGGYVVVHAAWCALRPAALRFDGGPPLPLRW